MTITVGYDHAAWPVGGYYAYDESTYDGPEYTGPFAWGRSEVEALDELAAQWASKKGYEDFTVEDLDREQQAATLRGDTTTLAFIRHLREYA